MPNSQVLLNIQPDGVAVELNLPMDGLERAFGMAITQGTETQLREYIKEHLQAFSQDNRLWSVDIRRVGIRASPQSSMGRDHLFVVVRLWLTPPAGGDTHDLTMKYDVIMHQLLNHSALVTVQQDWKNGIYADEPVHVGVVSMDLMSNTVSPLEINLGYGSWWKGFSGMVGVGMHHIAEGIDHLLFLLVLLFAAPLLIESGRWAGYGGMRYSLMNLLKIVTAFTLGHSVTLLAGTLDWFSAPSQIIEILIAFSILISAVHALRPIFPRREAYVAAGFGLIHGLAFAEILKGLNLGAGQLALSLLGFNIGIEVMQLIIIALIMPWLIILSHSTLYKGVRIGGAIFSGVAAIGWMIERMTGQSNPITQLLESMVQYAPWVILFLAILAISNYVYHNQVQLKLKSILSNGE